MKLNLKSNNANLPPADVRKPAISQGNAVGSRIANLKKLKQRQFGEYCFDYIVQCKHNLSNSSYHACPMCKLTQQVTRAFFEKENKQRERNRLESNIARARLRRQLIYMWSMCQPSFYPSHYQGDPYFEIIFSDQLLQALNENQAIFDDWFQTQNTMLIKGQFTPGKPNTNLSSRPGVDFSEMIRIIERRIRINDVGHIAATFLQARIRRFLTQVRLRYVLLKRFEYIPETPTRGAIFYDSWKQRKWQRFPNLLANDRPATPRTINRRINHENQLKNKKLEKYRELVRKRNSEHLSNSDGDGNLHNSISTMEIDNIQLWWDREERLVHIFEHLVILRDLVSVYFYTMRNTGHTGPVWFIPTAPGLHSRNLGLSIALQTLPSPALALPPIPKVVVNDKPKPSSLATKVLTGTNSSGTGSAGVLNPSTAGNDGSNTIPTATLNRALFLLEQAARDALCVTTPEEVASLVIRSPELRDVYESVAHITYDGVDEIWNGELSFQPYESPSDLTPVTSSDDHSITSQKNLVDDMSASSHLQGSDDLESLGSMVESLDASKTASLLPYGVILRPLNAAFRNSSSDNTGSTINSTYSKPSAAQFFRLFYMDEELLGICPCSNWVFYPEVHRFRDNIFNGIRKFSTTSATRNMVRQYYQHHQHYRQRLFLRRQQIVVLKRRLRRLLHLQKAYQEFSVDEKTVEEVIISSPNVLSMVVSSFTQQSHAQTSHYHPPKLSGSQFRAGFSSGNNSYNNSVKSKTTSSVNTKDKPPLSNSHQTKRSAGSNHATPSEGSSLFAPIPEMIFPSYVDTNRDSYPTQINLVQSILSLDRSRVNYLQETYGKMAFLRRNAVFQEKWRRTQISNNRAPANITANAAKGGGSVVSTSSVTIDANELMVARRQGLLLQHRWKSPHNATKHNDPSQLMDKNNEADKNDYDSLATSHSIQVNVTNDKFSNDKKNHENPHNHNHNHNHPPQHPIKEAFTLALAAATTDLIELSNPSDISSNQNKYHQHDNHSPNSSSSRLFLGGDVFRLIQSIPGNNIPIPVTKTTASGATGHNINNTTNDETTITNSFFLGEYVKRLYEYSVNVHTCIRDRLEEASTFVRYPEEDIATAGLPVPFFERTNPQKQPQPDMESYLQQLDKEISRLESEAVAALENFELKAIEENNGILSDAARIRKADRESRLIAALNKLKSHSQAAHSRPNEDEEDLEEAKERARYEENFPSPTLLALEVYVHLPTRPTQPTGAGAVNNARRNGVSILVAPGSTPVPMPVSSKIDDNDSVGDDNSSIGSGSNMDTLSLESSAASVANAATLAARRRNSMYGFVDPSTGFTPTVTVHQILGMYSCDDITKTPEHLDCGLFSFEYFRAIYREKQELWQQQQQQLWAKRGGGSRGDDGNNSRKSSAVAPGPLGRQQSAAVIKQAGPNSLRSSSAVNAANVLTPPAHLTVDNVTWLKDINPSSGIVVGQVLSQPSHKMECQFLYLAQSPSRDFLEKSLPRKIKLWLGMTAPDKTFSTTS